MCDFLKQEIRSGAINTGDHLPTETKLAQKYGVSRTVIREALAALKNDGVIASHQGRGNVVLDSVERQSFRVSDVFESITRSEVNYIFEVRAILESEAAALAAKRGREEDVARIKTAFEMMEEAVEKKEHGSEAHLAFNCAIAEASGNPALSNLLSFLYGQLKTFARKLRMDTLQDPCRTDKVRAEHRAIVEAICSKNAEMVRKATKSHLQNASERAGMDILD
ncbi:MAG: FadR family transcriptional regulator [Clostridiales bacterium]|nr:FadR family transcriptional regulator [Clostridiales bacterium]